MVTKSKPIITPNTTSLPRDLYMGMTKQQKAGIKARITKLLTDFIDERDHQRSPGRKAYFSKIINRLYRLRDQALSYDRRNS